MHKKIWHFEHDEKANEWKLKSAKITGESDKHVFVKTGRINKASVCFTPEDCLQRFMQSMTAAIRLKQVRMLEIMRGLVCAENELKKRKNDDGSKHKQ